MVEVYFNRLLVDLEIHIQSRSMSDPTLFDIDYIKWVGSELPLTLRLILLSIFDEIH